MYNYQLRNLSSNNNKKTKSKTNIWKTPEGRKCEQKNISKKKWEKEREFDLAAATREEE